jgi:cysteine desulfurase/selenocysteine lyase
MALSLPGLLPDLDVIRKDFPILSRAVSGGRPLVYLDSANTSQKPRIVIDTMVDHLERHNANIARAMHTLGAESTEAFEGARDKVAAFIGAPEREGVVFTKNITEALNLLANTFAWAEGDLTVGPGDERALNVYKLNAALEPAKRNWTRATLVLSKEGKFELQYDYAAKEADKDAKPAPAPEAKKNARKDTKKKPASGG